MLRQHTHFLIEQHAVTNQNSADPLPTKPLYLFLQVEHATDAFQRLVQAYQSLLQQVH